MRAVRQDRPLRSGAGPASEERVPAGRLSGIVPPSRALVLLAVAAGALTAVSDSIAAPAAANAEAARLPRAPEQTAPRALVFDTTPPPDDAAVDVEAASFGPAPSWTALPPIAVENRNTNARADIRLYRSNGAIDEAALRRFEDVAGSAPTKGKPSGAPAGPAASVHERLARRTVQLVFRAAYHFGGKAVTIVSATRTGAHGKHGTGEAIDFKLADVDAAVLAAHLRTYPRAGVGIYTHPRTRYVHLDVRDHSYHWLDASPPGISWREKLLPDPSQAKRDGGWSAAFDRPEFACATGADPACAAPPATSAGRPGKAKAARRR